MTHQQTIFRDRDERLILQGFNIPLSVEEIIVYLRVLANQLEEKILNLKEL